MSLQASSETQIHDVALIGGGIVGCATALALSERPGLSVVVLEAEDRLAAHQTGNNSGVIHSGLYYKPGSLKARLCVTGREDLYRFAAEHGIAHERCGKLVVATREEEIPRLDELQRRGQENGLVGLQRLGPEELGEVEPHVRGVAGLRVPETGIIDYRAVTEAFARLVRERGGEIRLNSRVHAVRPETDRVVLETASGVVQARYLINCAGLQSDRVARRCGVAPGLQIVPFRGEYYELVPEKHHLCRHLIYPVPDPRFPFLGVHFTRMIGGGVEAGPNAVLAFKREGYRHRDMDLGDLLQYGLYGGFWKMALRYWAMGLGEFYRSFSKAAFVAALQGLIPEITAADVHRGGAGVRAQALEPDGSLSDDFRIREAARQLHVLNAPSPAATASIAIGREIAGMAVKGFGLD
ncbi:MAG: L-2-hydroxyglutarate oxidase [Pseudomonadota bacterium]